MFTSLSRIVNIAQNINGIMRKRPLTLRSGTELSKAAADQPPPPLPADAPSLPHPPHLPHPPATRRRPRSDASMGDTLAKISINALGLATDTAADATQSSTARSAPSSQDTHRGGNINPTISVSKKRTRSRSSTSTAAATVATAAAITTQLDAAPPPVIKRRRRGRLPAPSPPPISAPPEIPEKVDIPDPVTDDASGSDDEDDGEDEDGDDESPAPPQEPWTRARLRSARLRAATPIGGGRVTTRRRRARSRSRATTTDNEDRIVTAPGAEEERVDRRRSEEKLRFQPIAQLFPNKQGNTRKLRQHIVYAAQFFPDVRYGGLLASLHGREIMISSVSDDGRIRGVPPAYEDEDPDEEFFCCAWTVDPVTRAPWLAVAGKSRIVKIVDISRGKLVKTLVGHGYDIWDLKFHPRHATLLFSASRDHQVRLWDVRRERTVAIFAGEGGHKAGVASLAVHDEGKMLLSGGQDHHLKIWSLTTPHLRHAILHAVLPHSRHARLHPECRGPALPVHVHAPTYSTSGLHSNWVDCVAWYGDWCVSRSAMEGRVVMWRAILEGEKEEKVVGGEEEKGEGGEEEKGGGGEEEKGGGEERRRRRDVHEKRTDETMAGGKGKEVERDRERGRDKEKEKRDNAGKESAKKETNREAEQNLFVDWDEIDGRKRNEERVGDDESSEDEKNVATDEEVAWDSEEERVPPEQPGVCVTRGVEEWIEGPYERPSTFRLLLEFHYPRCDNFYHRFCLDWPHDLLVASHQDGRVRAYDLRFLRARSEVDAEYALRRMVRGNHPWRVGGDKDKDRRKKKQDDDSSESDSSSEEEEMVDERVVELDPGAAGRAAVRHVSVSWDGKFVAAGGDDGKVRIWRRLGGWDGEEVEDKEGEKVESNGEGKENGKEVREIGLETERKEKEVDKEKVDKDKPRRRENGEVDTVEVVAEAAAAAEEEKEIQEELLAQGTVDWLDGEGGNSDVAVRPDPHVLHALWVLRERGVTAVTKDGVVRTMEELIGKKLVDKQKLSKVEENRTLKPLLALPRVPGDPRTDVGAWVRAQRLVDAVAELARREQLLNRWHLHELMRRGCREKGEGGGTLLERMRMEVGVEAEELERYYVQSCRVVDMVDAAGWRCVEGEGWCAPEVLGRIEEEKWEAWIERNRGNTKKKEVRFSIEGEVEGATLGIRDVTQGSRQKQGEASRDEKDENRDSAAHAPASGFLPGILDMSNNNIPAATTHPLSIPSLIIHPPYATSPVYSVVSMDISSPPSPSGFLPYPPHAPSLLHASSPPRASSPTRAPSPSQSVVSMDISPSSSPSALYPSMFSPIPHLTVRPQSLLACALGPRSST